MTPALITFLIEQLLPFVLKELPTILSLLAQYKPAVHAEVVKAVSQSAKDQGPNFDWHSGP